MSVRQSLLAILDQGPCYGYQLRAEFERRTGRAWLLNVGQVYNTLERLERDGLVARGEADEQGLSFWAITDAGRAAAAAWLQEAVVRTHGTRDELVMKLAVAATLPGGDPDAIIRTQRAQTDSRLSTLRDERDEIESRDEGAVGDDAAEDDTGPECLARLLTLDSMIESAEAELRWLERSARRLLAHPAPARSLALSTERPRRGRPARSRSAS